MSGSIPSPLPLPNAFTTYAGATSLFLYRSHSTLRYVKYVGPSRRAVLVMCWAWDDFAWYGVSGNVEHYKIMRLRRSDKYHVAQRGVNVITPLYSVAPLPVMK
jgi:hypothetical protein